MSGFCWVEDCLNNATQRCSGCKTAFYCSSACQQKNWPTHKVECKMHRLVYDLQEKEEKEEKKKPAEQSSKKPRTTHCTGCGWKFGEDEVEVDQKCPDCGYLTCESCSCHTSKGTCYCDDSNFGYPYCNREPRSYHFGKNGSYKGDYHPAKSAGYDLNKEDMPEAFEEEARPCNRCGEVVFCLKEKYKKACY